MTTTMSVCKFCASTAVVKNGKQKGIQRYLCKQCRHKFLENGNGFVKMRMPDHVVVTALNLYFGGLSTRKVAEQLNEIYGEKVSQVTIWSWIQKYSNIVAEYVKTLQPNLSGKYHHDETEIRVGGDGRFFWETLDEDTRFIVAHLLTKGRTTEHAKKVFQMGKDKQKPIALFTDGSLAYDNAFYAVFDTPFRSSTTEWIRRVGIRSRETNNIVERLHGTLKDRLKPMRGLKKDKSAQTLLDGYVAYYNFCRNHQALKCTPAQAAGLQVKGWKELIEKAQAYKTKNENAIELTTEVKIRN